MLPPPANTACCYSVLEVNFVSKKLAASRYNQQRPHPLSFFQGFHQEVRLRLGIAALVVLVTIPVTAYGHAEIFFPKLFSPAELATSGFVLLNPDPLTATVYVCLLSASGPPPPPQELCTPTILTIPPGGQLARLGTDLFPNATAPGWVYVLNDTEGMQAFWLSYNADLTFMDGAAAAGYDTIGADQILPLVAGETELNIINPNFIAVTVTIRLFGPDGPLAPAVTRGIPIAGALQVQVSDLFPSADMAQARYLRVASSSATAAIASSGVIRGFMVSTETLVVNGVNVSAGLEMTFPHVVTGKVSGADYTTVFGITNLSPSSQTVSIMFYADAGDPITVVRTLKAGESLRETAQILFGLTSDFQSGWVSVRGTAAITGFAGYSDAVGGGLAVVPAATAQTKLFFSHIANGPPQWQTGLALLNTTGNAVNVDVYAMHPNGSPIGATRFTLGAGRKTAKVIHELIPQTAGVNGGFVFVSADAPVHGIELFYTHDLKVLSNVAAGRLEPGVSYTPPLP